MKNWFEEGGRAYALHRPDYPPELAGYLADISPGRGVAVDVGCGSGQLTVRLAGHFSRVIGTDSSADQIANAMPHVRVEYRCAPAGKQPIPDQTADLVTAAQAVHWFDMQAFCAEVIRVTRPGGGLWSPMVLLVSKAMRRTGSSGSSTTTRWSHIGRLSAAMWRMAIGTFTFRFRKLPPQNWR